MTIIPVGAAFRGRCIPVPIELAASGGMLTARCAALGLEVQDPDDPVRLLLAAIGRRAVGARVRYLAVVPGGRG